MEWFEELFISMILRRLEYCLLPGRTIGHVGTINQLMRTGVIGDTDAERCKVFSSLLG